MADTAHGIEMTLGALDSPSAPVPLAERAYRLVLERLAAGDPDQRLVEQELADAFSMSRTPVREAMRRLAAEGVIRKASGRSYVARQSTPRDLLDHYDLRLLLEPEAAALCALRASADEAEHLRELEAVADSADFHLSVAAMCGNVALELVIGILVGYPVGRSVASAVVGQMEQRRTSHSRILDGIRDHDSGIAAAAMRDHLEALRTEATRRSIGGTGPR